VVVDGKTEDSDGKTESGRRTISLDPLTVAYLRRHLAMLDAEVPDVPGQGVQVRAAGPDRGEPGLVIVAEAVGA
jgi:hypothetical protein